MRSNTPADPKNLVGNDRQSRGVASASIDILQCPSRIAFHMCLDLYLLALRSSRCRHIFV